MTDHLLDTPIEEDAPPSQRFPLYAEVALDVRASFAERQFYTYGIPEQLAERARLGSLVLVPLGQQTVGGYIAGLTSTPPEFSVRAIAATLETPVLPDSLLHVLHWAADYYCCPLVSLLQAAIPPGVFGQIIQRIVLTAPEDQFRDFLDLQEKEWRELGDVLRRVGAAGISPKALKQRFGHWGWQAIQRLKRLDWVEQRAILSPPKQKAKQQKHALLTGHQSGDLSKRQWQVLDYLGRHGGCLPVSILTKEFGTTAGTLKRLAELGAIALEDRTVWRRPMDGLEGDRSFDLTLHPAQEIALTAIAESFDLPVKKTFLLHGVTGSGKTEVYLRAIELALQRGQQALVLVPEISLTPQMLSRFRARFGDRVAVLHSALGEGERFDEWHRIQAGLAPIVIGARSAIFAPCHNLGLIIVDEEHEGSYKQDTHPRYHARQLAEQLAKVCQAVLVLGSATPSLESYHATVDGDFQRLDMPERVEQRPLPTVHVIDLRQELSQGNRTIFSRLLARSIDERLTRQEQVILFINRRGYTTFVMCRDCGHTVNCTQCDVSMTYHRSHEHLRCHYCGSTAEIPVQCPACRSVRVKHFGTGTQKIEDLTKARFPTARILRLDRDTVTKKDSMQEILGAFGAGEADILIGTQMVAKGHDFPNVTLVAALAADGGLSQPDFRASERTFQLLTQVAGRAGRGDRPGDVVIQTYDPLHPAIQAASHHDFLAFYNGEIVERSPLHYPPFAHLVMILIASTDAALAQQAALDLGSELRSRFTDIQVLGPIPPTIPRIKGFYRQQILLKVGNLTPIQAFLKDVIHQWPHGDRAYLSVDVDPQHVL